MSHGIRDYWFIIIPIVIAIAIGIKYFAGTNPGKHVFGKITLKLPLFKKLTVKSAAAMMARTLSTLIGAGVPLIEAVDIVSGVMSNIYFKEALQDAREEITIGMPLSRPLQESGLFPPMVYQMIRIGEEAGSTEEMLDKIADYYDEDCTGNRSGWIDCSMHGTHGIHVSGFGYSLKLDYPSCVGTGR